MSKLHLFEELSAIMLEEDISKLRESMQLNRDNSQVFGSELTKKEAMFDNLRDAMEREFTFFAIKVIQGSPLPELIVNRHENFESKLAYWDKVYDDDLNHKFSPGILIVGWATANNYADIQKLLD